MSIVKPKLLRCGLPLLLFVFVLVAKGRGSILCFFFPFEAKWIHHLAYCDERLGRKKPQHADKKKKSAGGLYRTPYDVRKKGFQ